MQRQGLLTEKQAVDVRGGIRRFFKENPYENLSYEEFKNIPQSMMEISHPDEKVFYDKVLDKFLKNNKERASDFNRHLDAEASRVELFEHQNKKRIFAELEKRNLEAQQAAQQAHVDTATNRMHNLGQDALLATGGLGVGLYSGKKLYDQMRKQSSAEIAEKVAVSIGNQRLQAAKDFFTTSFNSLDRYLAGHHTPEELKAFYMKVRNEAEATGAKAHPELKPLYESLLAKFKQAHDFVTANPVPIKPPKPSKPTPTAKQPKQPNKPSSPRSSSSSSSSSDTSSSPKWPLRTAIGLLGVGGLTGAGMLGHHLYKEHEANKMLKESQEQPLTEEQIQALRLASLTPEQRALYLQVNPAGVPKMATNKEAGFFDFFRGPIGRKSPEFSQGIKTIDEAAKNKKLEEYLAARAKSKGLNMAPTGELSPAAKPGFLQRNKWPLGLLAAGAGGLYLMNQNQDKYSAYDETLTHLGLGKLAAAMPSKMPPIPFKAKSQAARQGKPFFTPSQAEHAKKLEGPAHTKAPWENMKTSAFNEGYLSVLCSFSLDKSAAADRFLANVAKAVTPKTTSVPTSKIVNLTAAKSPKAPAAVGGSSRVPKDAYPSPAVASTPAPVAVGGSSRVPKDAYPAPAVAPAAPAAKEKGLLGKAKDKVKDFGSKAQEEYGKLPTWGKGMVLGGGGMGLLGGGMGLGSALSSPPPPVVIAR